MGSEKSYSQLKGEFQLIEEMEKRDEALLQQSQELDQLRNTVKELEEKMKTLPAENRTSASRPVIATETFPDIPTLERWDDESLVKLFWEWKAFEQRCKSKNLVPCSILTAIPMEVSRPLIAEKLSGNSDGFTKDYVERAMQTAKTSRPQAFETLIFKELDDKLIWCEAMTKGTQALDKLMGDMKVILEEASLLKFLDSKAHKYDSKKICHILLEKVQPEVLKIYLKAEAETKQVGIDTEIFRKTAAEGLEALQKTREILQVAENKKAGISERSMSDLLNGKATSKAAKRATEETRDRNKNGTGDKKGRKGKLMNVDQYTLPKESNACVACYVNNLPYKDHSLGTPNKKKPHLLDIKCKLRWERECFTKYVRLHKKYMQQEKTANSASKEQTNVDKRLREMETKLKAQNAEIQAWRAGSTAFPQLKDPDLVQELGGLSEKTRKKLADKLEGRRSELLTEEIVELDCRRTQTENILAVFEFLTDDKVYQPIKGCLDSGADTEIFSELHHEKYCDQVVELENPVRIRVADNKYVMARKRGTLNMRFKIGRGAWTVVRNVRGYLAEGEWPEALFGKTLLKQLNALPEQHLKILAGKQFDYVDDQTPSDIDGFKAAEDDWFGEDSDFNDNCWAPEPQN